MIEKLLHGWKDFKNYLKYKRKEMSMEDLIVILRIEEDNRGSEKKINVATKKANMVEHAKSFKAKKTNSGKGQSWHLREEFRSRQNFKGSVTNVTKWVIGLLTAGSLRRPTRRKKQTWLMISPKRWVI